MQLKIDFSRDTQPSMPKFAKQTQDSNHLSKQNESNPLPMPAHATLAKQTRSREDGAAGFERLQSSCRASAAMAQWGKVRSTTREAA